MAHDDDIAGTGFNVGHDAIHGVISANRRVNALLAHVFDIMGANSRNWSRAHNVAHHTWTNVAAADCDIEPGPILRFHPYGPRRWFHRFQHVYAFALYGLAMVAWVTVKDWKQVLAGDPVTGAPPRARDVLDVLVWKLVHWGLYLAAPVVVGGYDVADVAVGYLTVLACAGLPIAIVFQLPHLGDKTAFPRPVDGRLAGGFFAQQLRTTANFATKSALVNFLAGGQNHQIEHHLFPRLCHTKLPAIADAPVTEYGVGLLATTQTFDIGAAKRDLGYAARVPVRDGLSRTIRHLKRTDDAHAAVSVELELLFTGSCRNWQDLVMAGTEHKKVPFHSMVAVVRHPTFGVTLFDAGYAPHFHAETRRFPFSLYARVTPVSSLPEQSACAQLQARGVGAHDVDRVIITHFHGDHIAGLRDFPNADLVCTGDAWRSVAGRSGVNAVRRGHVPGLLPADTRARLHLIERFDDAGVGPFARAHDLFGDGSVRLVPLPGHAAGQVGALVQAGPRRRVLLVADAAWTSRSYRERIHPHAITRFITDRHRDYVRSLDDIRAFAKAFPDVEIVPTHCPEVFARHGAHANALPLSHTAPPTVSTAPTLEAAE